MKSRAKLPTSPTKHNAPHCYVVWAHMPVFLEDKLPFKPVALFYYFQEALEYKDRCNKLGATVWLQSPVGVVQYDADGCRLEVA